MAVLRLLTKRKSAAMPPFHTGGGTIATVSAGETKTLQCSGKYMSTDVGIADKTLSCSNKIMSSDIGVTVESGVTNITISITGTGHSSYAYVTINETKYSSPNTVISTLGTIVRVRIGGGTKMAYLYINGKKVKSSLVINADIKLNSNCTINLISGGMMGTNTIEITGDAELVS